MRIDGLNENNTKTLRSSNQKMDERVSSVIICVKYDCSYLKVMKQTPSKTEINILEVFNVDNIKMNILLSGDL